MSNKIKAFAEFKKVWQWHQNILYSKELTLHHGAKLLSLRACLRLNEKDRQNYLLNGFL